MTIFDLLAQAAQAHPAAPAVTFREQTITYGALLRATEGLAGGLAALGLHRRPRIGLLLPNCPQFIMTYLAASRIGGTVIPINVLYRPDEVRYIMQDAEAEVLVTAEPFRPLVEALRPHLPGLKHVVMVAEEGLAADEVDFRVLAAQAAPRPVAVSARDVAVIIYTSGTTGRPKGAMLTHRNLLANAESCFQIFHVGPEDVLLSALPLFHAFAAMVFLLLALRGGARIQLMERFLPANTLALMEESRATLFGGVPSMFGLMLQVPPESRPRLAALRICVSGGAPLPPEVWTAFEQTYDVSLIEGYGLTEAAPVVAVNPPYGVRKPGSVGVPAPGVEVKLVDERGRGVPVGTIGELAVRGDNVMKGYLNRPAETKAAIRSGWLFTGDLARADEDGYLYIAGRKKELILVGGLNVYPGEVERVLVEHPAVLEAAVFGVPDATRGEAVWAAVVLRPDATATPRELQTFCRDRLADFKIPRGIDIRAELPKNALGKVMRHVISAEVGQRRSRAGE
jgi:long-chain acyl-CoA synthetase